MVVAVQVVVVVLGAIVIVFIVIPIADGAARIVVVLEDWKSE